jgi:hypothetical protein
MELIFRGYGNFSARATSTLTHGNEDRSRAAPRAGLCQTRHTNNMTHKRHGADMVQARDVNARHLPVDSFMAAGPGEELMCKFAWSVFDVSAL